MSNPASPNDSGYDFCRGVDENAPSGDFVFVDGAGLPIDGTAEASCLLATRYAPTAPANVVDLLAKIFAASGYGSKQRVSAGVAPKPVGESESDDLHQMLGAAVANDTEGRFTAAGGQWLKEAAAAANVYLSSETEGRFVAPPVPVDDDAPPVPSLDGALAKVAEHQRAVQDAEAFGAGATSRRFYSCDGSDTAGGTAVETEEEWILERIIRRKRTNLDDGPNEQDIDPVKGAAAVQAKSWTWSYLCKWRWYRQPTWEEREFLVDEGYGIQVDEYDANCAASRGSDATVPVKLTVKDAPLVHFTSLFPDIPAWLNAQLAQAGLAARRYASVSLPEHVNKRFSHTWRKNIETMAPVRVFYGTRRENIPSIMAEGFAPATGENSHGARAVAGSIFTCRDPALALDYATDSNILIVAVGVIGERYMTAGGNDRVVAFPSAAHLVPVWLVEFGPAASKAPPAPVYVRPGTLLMNYANMAQRAAEKKAEAAPAAKAVVQAKPLKQKARPLDTFKPA